MNVLEITSPQNPRYRTWIKLLDSRGIKKNKAAIISGVTFLEEIFQQHPERVSTVLVNDLTMLEGYMIPEGVQVCILNSSLYGALDIYGTRSPLLVIEAPELCVWDGTLEPGLTLFLPFQNPINLGTTVRTAAAFGANIVLLQEAASPYLPKCLRASGPSIFQVKLSQGPGLAELAQMKDLGLWALSPHGSDLFSFSFPETMGLVVGPEGPGLDAFWPEEQRLSIPMSEGVESLNAAISVAIALSCRKFSLK